MVRYNTVPGVCSAYFSASPLCPANCSGKLNRNPRFLDSHHLWPSSDLLFSLKRVGDPAQEASVNCPRQLVAGSEATTRVAVHDQTREAPARRVLSPESRPGVLTSCTRKNAKLITRDPDPYWTWFTNVSGSESGSRRSKMTHKSSNKLRNFMFWSTGCSLLRAEGFFCNLDVLYGGFGIGKL